MRKVRVEAPASSANLGPGFDVFGLALDVAYDVVEVEIVGETRRGIDFFEVQGRYGNHVPNDSRNLVYKLAEKLLDVFNRDLTIGIRLEKNVRPRSGLGSSGASSAAITLAILTLLGVDIDPVKAIELASLGEELVTGSRHADNVAPSMLGGFVIIRGYDPLDLVRLEAPENLGIVIATPEIEVPEEKTRYARTILPQQVPLKDVIHNIGHASYIATGFALKNVKLIAKGINDIIVEPRRIKLIPGGEKVKKKAIEAGALAATISGAGPSIIAIYDRKEGNLGDNIGRAMIEGFNEEGVKAEYYVTIASKGPRVRILS